MLSKIIKFLGGDPNQREIERLISMAEQINTLEPKYEALSDDALRACTANFKERIQAAQQGIEDEKARRKAEQDALQEILPDAFATVREAAKRTIGQRHYDVQLIGGMVLHYGRIAEMRTGEGKTLVGTLPIYLNALTGRGIHLITVNDFLARLHGRWMAQIYNFLGLSVGVLQMAAVTENGKKAFIVDLSKESPREDQDRLRQVDRREAYAADITYGTNAEFGFDYLRDNMVYRLEDKVQRGHYLAVIDEVDNVLIDEARTPLIISGPAQGDLEWYGKMALIVRQLRPEDYEVEEKDRTVIVTDVGYVHVEELLGQPLRDIDRPEDVTPEQARLLGYLEQAMRAQHLFKRNKDYLVQGGKVVIVDEFTGRQMPGRRWSDGLHQAVEAKEGVKVEPENITYATITLQNYFRMYQKLAGMTGTAITESEEFHKIYKLDVLPIPTHLEYQASRKNATMIEIKSKDEEGYNIAYFSRRDDAAKTPLFWRRTDYPDVVYRTVESKLRAIVTDILRNHTMGRPILVGTTSVDNSERLSNRLRAEPIRRLLQVRLMRDVWFRLNKKEEDGHLYKELEALYKPIDEIDAGTLRQFAKTINLNSINPEDPENLKVILRVLRLDEEYAPRLKSVIQGGVPHEVLNARKHTEESQIIAGAGAFGAVTIATNMAGRGVDIKLGGELAEEISISIARVLKKAGHNDPYGMRPQEQRAALANLSQADYGIYESEVRYFMQYFDDMERVRQLGGLHVIGSERHEARRIDNQLRGRSARQGDPGSSRFYLSLEDDLMRMFGGQQVNDMMQRLRIDDDFPLEVRIVSNIIEGSQHRVEGSNFDMRKHLLEYDDVLNAQRSKIYSQRDRVFLKDDLSEDVMELLRAEVAARVPAGLDESEGPWKLVGWLDQIQPGFLTPSLDVYPSFSYRLLLNEIDRNDIRKSIHSLVRRAVQQEESHLMSAIENAIDGAENSLETALTERMDSVDTFLDGLSDSDEPRRPQELLEELAGLTKLPIRFNAEQMRALQSNPRSLEDPIKDQLETQLTALSLTRLLGSIEFRLGETFPAREEIMRLDWNTATERVRAAVRGMLNTRLERLTGENGQLIRELDQLLARPETSALDESVLLRILSTLPMARRNMGFDAKTHRALSQEYQRFHYTYLAADLMSKMSADDALDSVLEHLVGAREAIEASWGAVLWNKALQGNTAVGELGLPENALGDLNPNRTASELNESEIETVEAALGLQATISHDRRILLGVISELWVDYLTKVEALRVSIGLEAYGQRDPLVQYKGKASEMFQTLMTDIRSGVVNNMFQNYPRISVQAAQPDQKAEQGQATEVAKPAISAAVASDDSQGAAKSGRKRHRKH